MKLTAERCCTHHTTGGIPCRFWALLQIELIARMTAQPDAGFIGEEEPDHDPNQTPPD